MGVEIHQGARHAVQTEHASIDLQPLRGRPLFRQANSRHLRIGKNHRRHGTEIEHGLATGHVDPGPAASGGGHIDELRLVGAIARRIDIRHVGLHSLIHLNRATHCLYADLFQVQLFGIGCAPGGDQQLLCSQFTRVGVQYELSIGVIDPAGLGPQQYPNAFLLKGLPNNIAYSRIVTG